jgi:hypothetical protein
VTKHKDDDGAVAPHPLPCTRQSSVGLFVSCQRSVPKPCQLTAAFVPSGKFSCGRPRSLRKLYVTRGMNMIKLLSSTTAVAAFLIVASVSQSSAKGFCGLLEGDKYNGSGTHVNACPKMGEYKRYHVTSPVRYRPGCDGHRPGESWLTYLDPARHHAVRHRCIVGRGRAA